MSPIDPRIPLEAAAPEIASPQQMLMQIMALSQLRQSQQLQALKIEDALRVPKERRAVAQAVVQGRSLSIPDREQLLTQLTPEARLEAETLLRQADQARREREQANQRRLAIYAHGVERANYHPQIAEFVLNELAADDPSVEQYRPLLQQPEQLKALVESLQVEGETAGWSRPKPPTLIQRDPTRALVNPETGEIVSQATPEPPEAPQVGSFEDYVTQTFGKRPTPRQLEEGRRRWADTGSTRQERAGYFTMTPVYDPQGRPIGALQLNARTGETKFLKPDALGGGVTTRPPGDLGKQTIEQEASLDALARLKTMFDQGAKDLIGPLAGRTRRTGQAVPGGIAIMRGFGQDTERFANFEAATRAFQNSIIKAITGAQMSEPEAKRIMGQIPNVEDHPTVWMAKYTQSVANLKDLERRLRQKRGTTPEPGSTPLPDPAGIR